MIANTRLLLCAAACAALVTTACSDSATSPVAASPASFAKGAVGGGGGTTAPATSVITYSNFGAAGAIPASEGWGATGVESTGVIGFFEDLTFQFSPTASGSITNLKLLIQKSFTNVGSDSYTVLLYTDDAAAPNTIGTLIGSFQGKAAPLIGTPQPSTISVSNGPTLQAGTNYWIRVVPALNSRITWWAGAANVYGWHFYEDLYQQYYMQDSATGGVGVQGAFEISVR